MLCTDVLMFEYAQTGCVTYSKEEGFSLYKRRIQPLIGGIQKYKYTISQYSYDYELEDFYKINNIDKDSIFDIKTQYDKKKYDHQLDDKLKNYHELKHNYDEVVYFNYPIDIVFSFYNDYPHFPNLIKSSLTKKWSPTSILIEKLERDYTTCLDPETLNMIFRVNDFNYLMLKEANDKFDFYNFF